MCAVKRNMIELQYEWILSKIPWPATTGICRPALPHGTGDLYVLMYVTMDYNQNSVYVGNLVIAEFCFLVSFSLANWHCLSMCADHMLKHVGCKYGRRQMRNHFEWVDQTNKTRDRKPDHRQLPVTHNASIMDVLLDLTRTQMSC